MISKHAIEDYHARRLDSMVWMKKIPREDILKELKTFKVKPVFKGHDRWTHQLVCFLIGMSYPEYLFLLDMGLGKTTIILDLMTQRQREGNMTKALVTVPRLINLSSWENDILRGSDFEPNLCMGDIEEKWERLVNPRGDISVVDYHGLQLALTKKKKVGGKNKLVRDDTKVKKLQKIYNTFNVDESHKAKNKDTLRFTLMRQLFKYAEFVNATTGTLFGRNPEDIWAQFFLVDNGETFGENLGIFREAFFIPEYNNFGGQEWKFDKKLTRPLYRMLQHRSIRYTEDEVPEVELPARHVIHLPVKFAEEQREHYLRAVDGLLSAKGRLSDIDSAFVRMRQITSGFLEWNDEHGKHTVNFPENPKLQALEKLIEESGDKKLIISHEYTQTGKIITEWLTKNGYRFEWLYGGSKDPVNSVNRFINDAGIKAFVMNSESGGTGTDGLQGVCQYLVIVECPCSPITRSQLIKRVHRPGQKKRSFIYDIAMENSIDMRILGFNAEGKNLYESIVNGNFSKSELI